jgi:hypothetical protein
MRFALVVAALGVAGCGYRAGSFHGPRGEFAGDRVTVGCLDVAVAPFHDAAAEGTAIVYEFGNRCDRPARVDLGAVSVHGRTADGRDVTLEPFDPLGELRVARLEARRTGREVIEYAAPAADALLLVCADVGTLDGGAGTSQEICVTAGGAR